MAPQKNSSTTKEPSTSESAIVTPPTCAQPPRQTNHQSSNPATNNVNSSKSQDSAGQPRPNPDTSSSSKKTSAPKSTTSDTLASTHSGSVAPESRPLTEIIGEKFAPFDHQRLVVGPFTEETARDSTFEEELGPYSSMRSIETHAYESQLAVQKLENKISDVIEVEKAQEQTRQRLNDFVVHMQTAIAALTGL
ncbi:hypothetical protein BT96DRAFT_914307 [Gymnopus androsaceus JB14]|uniref:Uncharacterized protein n=1 Tax=Gymnopus androsaceus JB14 TaxID=1447944 RepID=A0A6A4IH60_9AGAR|nr:hypothetical protein BT96DRAFT_914307 [Gymnopus androsaceus JB14]